MSLQRVVPNAPLALRDAHRLAGLAANTRDHRAPFAMWLRLSDASKDALAYLAFERLVAEAIDNHNNRNNRKAA